MQIIIYIYIYGGVVSDIEYMYVYVFKIERKKERKMKG